MIYINMFELRDLIVDLLNNQPNGIRIGCGRYNAHDVQTTPFHHLSRLQQIEQIITMITCGIDVIELQCELYLVCHKPTHKVWMDFGALLMPSLSDDTEEESDDTEEESDDTEEESDDDNNLDE